MRFENKVALVTGSSRGIGKAIALELAKEGAKLIINCSKTKEDGLNVVKEIQKMGSDAILIKCDVSSEDDVKAMVKEGVDKFGKIDILVNNAGIVYDIPFFEKTSEQWKETINTNLMSMVYCCKEVALRMKEQKIKGSIVNISSTNGINCFHPDSMDYDVTKAGVNLLTEDLAMELAPMIRVNAVAPGWVNTKINADLPKNFVEEEVKKIYVRRFAEPKEIAKVVSFLASEEASFVTGSIIKVDGGYGGWSE
ncbi:MAG: glucose 1-dehydrogenase [Nanoarchaeota archaeon]|jgi:3-oxoacyl-[acyl-carrier protein] reductase|nr:glucose 1-dehydrogenase [Nanoarchaeota archaeon]